MVGCTPLMFKSSTLKIGRGPQKEAGSSSKHDFFQVELLNFGGVNTSRLVEIEVFETHLDGSIKVKEKMEKLHPFSSSTLVVLPS